MTKKKDDEAVHEEAPATHRKKVTPDVSVRGAGSSDPSLTEEQHALCKQMGLTVGAINWKRLFTILQTLLELLNHAPVEGDEAKTTACVECKKCLDDACKCCAKLCD